ncbi:carboxypeptidase regulatory-like domain-containing protein [Halosolutus amylolyticus]|uniref:Carboxypeptidase regulatory-like domain-containing protein n=1 Tax=Halosolutus amylolyticus TaxID=2932267 RepID=A0ABD5PSD6_9EURY|nr:carboxypeptidase regulatory-like domain-containing protein [Halosolutus amylolyticus]
MREILTLVFAVALIASTASMGVAGATGTGATAGDERDDEVVRVVAGINEGSIAETNDRVAGINDRLENVEPVMKIDPLEAETREEGKAEAKRLSDDADRLQDDTLTQVPKEINEQAGFEMTDPDAIRTPQDARDEADRIESNYPGEDAERAAQALRDAADFVEEFQRDLSRASTDLLEVAAEPPTGTVEGTATDESGEPIAGVTVSIGGEEVTTDRSGSYEFELIEDEYTLRGSTAGYVDGKETVEVVGDRETTVDLTLEADERYDYRTVALPAAADAGETVVSEVDVEPIAATENVSDYEVAVEYDPAVVELEDVTDGEWVDPEIASEDPEAGTVTVVPNEDAATFDDTAAPFHAFGLEFTLVGDPGDESALAFDGEASAIEPELNLGMLDPTEDVTVAWADGGVSATPLGTIEGTVTDGDGEPVEGATVDAGEATATTDAGGAYELELRAGDYTLSVNAPNHRGSTASVSVTAGATETIDVGLDPEPGTVTGTVTDVDGAPIADATVTVDGTGTTTDDAGAYELTASPGDRSLTVDAPDYESATRAVSIDPAGTTTADVELEPVAGAGERAPDEYDGDPDLAPGDDGSERDDADERSGADEAGGDGGFDAANAADYLRDEADRLRADVFAQVVAEINAQSRERVGMEIANPVGTPAEAREEAEYIEETYVPVNEDAQEAADSLYSAADWVEEHHENLYAAADDMETADDPAAKIEETNAVVAAANDRLGRTNAELETVEDVDEIEPLSADADLESEGEEGSDADTDEGSRTDDADAEDAGGIGSATTSFGAIVSVLALLSGSVVSAGTLLGSQVPLAGFE